MKSIGIQLVDSLEEGGVILDLRIERKEEEGKIISGLVVGDILSQNQAMILMANPGEFHFKPTLGVGINEIILDDDYLAFRHRIREHFSKDGLEVQRLDFTANQPLKIQAKYGK